MTYNRRNVYFSATPLDISQALAIAPTIGATAPHADRSDRYGYVPTLEVLRSLTTIAGFQIHGVTTASVRDPRKAGFEKHLIRLRRPDFNTVKGTAMELILINSHDGSTCFELMKGMFRFACANGLICGDVHESVKIKHTVNMVSEIKDAAISAADDFHQIGQSIERMSHIELTRDERGVFADTAMDVRFGEDGDRPFDSNRLLIPHRHEDGGTDLWTTFNVVQENCTKGGITGRITGSNGRRRRTTTKDVNGIDQNVRVNRTLHMMAERMAELKEAA